MSLLGIDVGTTGCKVIAFDDRGRPIARDAAEYPLEFPHPGWIELDPDVVWQKLAKCIRSVASRTRRNPIKAIAISAQGEAFLPVDRRGNPLSNSIVTFDSRASRNVEWWDRAMGRMKIFRITGMPLSAMGTLPKLQWLLKNKRSTRSAAYFLCYHDFVVMKLGLRPAIDYSLAARTMMFDIRSLAWSDPILAALQVDRERFAQPVKSGSVIGKVSPVVAQKLGLPKDALVVAGGHDQPCAALGAGAMRSGEAAYSVGTVECITPVFDHPVSSALMMRNNLCSYPHVVPGKFVSLAFNFTGGSLLKWYRDTFGGTYESLVRASSPEPTKLLVLPHFTMTGTPSMETRSKGVIAGLQLSTSKGEITRSLLEGVTYEMRHNIELLERSGVSVRKFRAVGGGSKSRIWMQIKADIMNRPIEVMEVNEAGCLGAALLAGVAAGTYASAHEATRTAVRSSRVYDPDNKSSRYYAERYALYSRLYPSLAPLLHVM
jgi:xylulokinase